MITLERETGIGMKPEWDEDGDGIRRGFSDGMGGNRMKRDESQERNSGPSS